MEVYRDLAKLKGRFRNPIVTLGNFDGVHLGHQKIFNHLSKRACEMRGEAVVFTFDPHPAKVLRPEMSPRLITEIPEKLKLLESLGIHSVILADFTKMFASLHPTVFVQNILVNALSAKHIVVGHDFSFGKGKEGTIYFLKEMGLKLDFSVDVVEAFKIGGEIVSSTAIRKLISAGYLSKTAQLLGRNYSIKEKVIMGCNRGKKLGFPTANLNYGGELLPKDGVYAARVNLAEREMDGIVNVGVKPTFGVSDRNVEVHIFDFDEQIYDKELEVVFLDRVRDERSFKGPDELVAQIEKDIDVARNIIRRKII